MSSLEGVILTLVLTLNADLNISCLCTKPILRPHLHLPILTKIFNFIFLWRAKWQKYVLTFPNLNYYHHWQMTIGWKVIPHIWPLESITHVASPLWMAKHSIIHWKMPTMKTTHSLFVMRSSKMSLTSVKFNFHFSDWLYISSAKLPFTTDPIEIGPWYE